MEMKICTKCGSEKPINEFYKKKASPDGHAPTCIVCHKATRLARIDKDREGARLRAKKYRDEHKDEINKQQREWRKKNADVLAQRRTDKRRTEADAESMSMAAALNGWADNRTKITLQGEL